MIVTRPCIYIYVNNPDKAILREVYSGIEEEGVFYRVVERDETELNKLAFDAANDSMLGSGIGITGSKIALQIKGLDLGKNVESYDFPTPLQSRNLGTNSARAIKKQSFK